MAPASADFVSITLAPTVDAPGIARRFAGELAAPGTPADAVEVLELLVSELVSDAVLHHTAWCNIGIEAGTPITRVEVTDPAAPDDEAPISRTFGAKLLDGLAERWGAEPCGSGRMVWFELRTIR
jgi:hypothetical protein